MVGSRRGAGTLRHRATALTTKKRPAVGIFLVLLVIVLPALLFFVVPVALISYDDGHRMSVTCTVRSAATGSESSRSFRGGGGGGTQVVVVTEECGKILLQDGINSFNADRVAKALEQSRRARFTVGEATYRLRDVLATVGISPAAYDHRVEP